MSKEKPMKTYRVEAEVSERWFISFLLRCESAKEAREIVSERNEEELPRDRFLDKDTCYMGADTYVKSVRVVK
jgi:hypothetical protein